MPPSAVPTPRHQSVQEAATVAVRGFPAQLWLYTQRAFLQRIKGTEMASYLLVSVVAGSIMGIVSCGNDLLILRYSPPPSVNPHPLVNDGPIPIPLLSES
jgi:hypothetical protein